MKKLWIVFTIGIVCSGVMLVRGAQPNPDKDQDGVEALTRGPVHEAYAAPETLNPGPSPIVPKKPPEPVQELPPDQKPDGSHVVWLNGYWAWDDESADFMWVSGFWRDVPPGQRWLPGHWTEIGGGWQWASGFWAPEATTQVNYVPAPPPTLETGPSAPAPAVDQIYSPGCWVYVQRQYRWRPGFWVAHRPNWVYCPARYAWTPAGCVFVDGFWDYELTRRGLLFCPIRFTANVWTRPGWRFSPRYIVYPEVIVSALFVRPDYHRYCFGDYFGKKFVEHGFVPWVDYRLHKNIPEPLFHQYALANRNVVNWERDLRKLYDDRRTGIVPRPPHSIAQQQQFMRDLAEHKAIKIADKNFAIADVKHAERNLMMVNTLAKVDRKVIPLKTLTPAAHAEVIKAVEHHTEVRVERKTTEIKILKETPVFRPNDVHQVGKIPVIPNQLKTPIAVKPPVIPVLPKHVEKVVPKYEPPRPVHASPKPLVHGALQREVTSSVAQAARDEPRRALQLTAERLM